MTSKFQIVFLIFLGLLFSMPIIFSYLHAGYFPTHDGEWAVVRLSDMVRSLKDFQFPVRYSGYLNSTYGYPLFNFAYPFPYYFAAAIHFLGIGFVNSVKILFALSLPVSFIFMALLIKKLYGSFWGALASSVLYIYYPYRIIDLYVRGSLGESLSFALFPMILYFLVSAGGKNTRNIIFAGISFALLIGTHNIMTILFAPVVLVFLVFLLVHKKISIGDVVIFAILALGLSAFFWVPAILEKGNIVLSLTPIADRSLYFVTVKDLVLPKWGYGLPTDKINGFGYQIGLPQIGIFTIALFLLGWSIIKKKVDLLAGMLGILTLIFIFLMFPGSAYIWKYTPLLKEINYPWTILGPLGILIGVLTGYVSSLKNGLYLSIPIAILSVLFVFPHLKPSTLVDHGDDYYSTNQATTTSSNELMPVWVKKTPLTQPLNTVEVSGGNAQSVIKTSNKVEFDSSSIKNTSSVVNVIYYPGWLARIDGKGLKIDIESDTGLMKIPIPKAKHHVQLRFAETPLRLVSDLISVFSFFAVIVLLIWTERRVIQSK